LPKAEEAFRNIGEVASDLGVKKHVLRFWEQKFPQLRPMKLGGGRRLYRPADVQLLKGIRHLLRTAGYSIKGVQKLLREQGLEQVKQAASGRIGGGPEGAPPAKGPAAAIRRAPPAPLTSVQVQALRSIMAELDACHAILAAAPPSKQERSFQKRVGRAAD
jgi:DNA-binding transcriptional MerR regulator